MSHYSVAVFTNDECTYEELLEPYDENLRVPHYIQKSEIISSVREEIERYKNSWYADYLKNPKEYIEKYNRKEHIEYITKIFPTKLNWTDEECYADGVKYYDEEDIKSDGSVFERSNPNAKWDWYEVGGRFCNLIPLTDGSFDNEADMCDVNINYRDEKEYTRAIKFWKLYIDGEIPVTEEEKEIIKYSLYKKEYYTKRYKDAEDYADDCSAFTFYAALLPNGEWLEPGSVGWWGISLATEEAEIAWRSKVKDVLKQAQKENWHITIVDCHI